MSGTWTGASGKVEMEEHWTSVRGTTLLGLHRDTAEGRTVAFEFLRIEETSGGLVYQAQPGGRPAVAFTCIETGPTRVVFENKTHDFPQRILYWKTADGALHARIEGMADGKPAGHEWTWTKAR